MRTTLWLEKNDAVKNLFILLYLNKGSFGPNIEEFYSVKQLIKCS